MEISQQQRRPAVGQLAQALAEAKLPFDAIDLADMLWLAQFTEQGNAEPSDHLATKPEPKDSIPGQTDPQATTPAETALNLYSTEPPPPRSTSPEQAETEQVEPAAPKPQGLPFSVPAASAIRTRMDLARSLRPLMRKVPSRTRLDLDEEATVRQIAETEVWMPVVRPTPERWLELEIVVEASKTTVIWERVITELIHLAEYQGAFRTVRTWRLSAQGERVQLFPRWRDGITTATAQGSSARPHTPRELIDPTGRRLVWLVTDCTSSLWRQGLIHPALQQWARAQPVAIVQMFPDSLWKRTALRDGHPVRLSALAPGLPNAHLEIDGLPSRLEQRSGADLVTMPIVTLEAQMLRHWARMMAGAGDSHIPGRVFDLAFIKRQAEAFPAPTQNLSSPTAQDRVDRFRATTASATVRHLANLIAATPVISLPVIDLLRDSFRADFEEEVHQSHVAEVLLSGLLRRCDTESDAACRYEFWGDDSDNPEERVRDRLLGDASVTKTLEVLNRLSAAIELKVTSPVNTFQALLAAMQTSDDDQFLAETRPFAQVGLRVLHRLGGDYAVLARQYEQALQQGQTHQQSAISAEDYFNSLPLQDIEYEVAEYLNFPPLETFEFIEATLNFDQDFERDLYRLLEQHKSEIDQLIIQDFEEKEIRFQIDMHPREVLSENINDSEISISDEQDIFVEFTDYELIENQEAIVFQVRVKINFAVTVGYFDNDGYISEIHESIPHEYLLWPDQSADGIAVVSFQVLGHNSEANLIDAEVDSVTLELETPVVVRPPTEPQDSVPELNQDLEPFEFTIATLHQDGSQWRIQRSQGSAYRFIELLSEPSSQSSPVTLEMVAIPGGTFMMGSQKNEPDRSDLEGPQHRVTVPPFIMGRYPITQDQWRVVAALPQIERTLEANPSRFKGGNRPVENVSWHSAAEFCARLSAYTGRLYRLPSEAEWEYACRAGTTTPFSFGKTITPDLANYDGNYTYANGPKGKNRNKTIPVDHFGMANAFGLCGMHGNVYEWCQDHWHSNYEGAPTDGSAWIEGGNSKRRIRRGGSWVNNPRSCRSAYRDNISPGGRYNGLGFRVCCAAPSALLWPQWPGQN